MPEADDDFRIALDPAYVLPRRVAWWAERDPDRPFLIEVTGRSAGYGEVMAGVRRWCAVLTAHGIGPGDRIVTLIPSSIDAHLLWLAAGCLGACDVPVNPDLRGAFLTHVLTDAGAKLCVARPELAGLPASVGIELETVVVPRAGLPAEGPELEPSMPAPADVSCVIYTSGSTGMPKGVLVTWAQMAASIGRIPRSWLSEKDAVYSAMAMFHVTGRSPLIAMSDVGGRVVLREKFSTNDFWDDVRRFGVTSTTAHVGFLLARPERPDDADNPLRVVFGGHDAVVNQRFARRFNVHVMDAYGSTEAGFPILARWPLEGSRSCGWPRRGFTARIVDENRQEVPDGTVGELEVKPPARELMAAGYLNRPDLTAAAFVDGWYRTGDAMRRLPDGRYEFVDRLKDTIRRLGENISATGMESVVVNDPDIMDCAVVGVPDRRVGQAVLLAVQAREGVTLDPEDVAGRLATELPGHMHPAYIDVWDELPRTPTGKVRKPDVLEGHHDGAAGLRVRWVAPAAPGREPVPVRRTPPVPRGPE